MPAFPLSPITEHWCVQYVGTQWVRGAQGPDVFDCWGLLYWCYQKHIGEDIPKICIDWENSLAVSRAIDDAAASSLWTRIPRPVEGAAVGMSKARRFHHVGLYIEADRGLILHTQRSKGCTLQTISELRAEGFARIEFFIPTSWLSLSKFQTRLSR